MKKNRDTDSFINASLFLGAIAIIALLMIASYAATVLLPCRGISVGRWLLSPVLVLGTDVSVTLIAVIVFMLIIGGVFSALEKAGIMLYLLDFIADRFGTKKYRLLIVMTFFFMAVGSLVGSFEECVPLVPIVVALSVKLGWDALTGISMSLLAVGCGFAAGVFNPFTIGIAQEMAGLPMFSGAGFRAVCFVFIYALLLLFTLIHAKRVDKGIQTDKNGSFQRNRSMEKAAALFVGIVAFGLVLVLSSTMISALRDYTFPIISVMFLVAGLCSCRAGGMSRKELGRVFGKGAVSMLPAVVMILMAASIRYTLEYAGVLDMIVDSAVALASRLPGWMVILFIYLFVLIMNFFIASGSAKAIMLMPLLLPLAEPFGISSQLLIVAFAFGDGFSNVFYPTNPALLVALSLADTRYSRWFRWSAKFQLCNLLLTSLLLLAGRALGV